MTKRFRFVPPAGTPVHMPDIWWWIRHALGNRNPVQDLEADLQKRLGIRHIAFVSTGRAALTIALQALASLEGWRRKEIVIPAYTCYSVAASVAKAGLTVRLADIDQATLDFEPGVLDDALDPDRVLAVVATNLYGYPSHVPSIARVAGERGIFVVDDAAQCLGGTIEGRYSGTCGDVGLYSLDKGKNITSIDGGILVTNSDRIAAALGARIEALPGCSASESAVNAVKLLAYAALLHPSRYWLPNALPFVGLGGTSYRTDYPLAGYDGRMAPIARRLLGRLDTINAQRTANAERLRNSLPWGPQLRPVVPRPGAVPAYLRFPILVAPESRNTVVAALQSNGFGASASYPRAIVDIPELQGLLEGDRETPCGREVARRIVTLPTHGYVTERDCDQIVRIVTDCLRASSGHALGRHSLEVVAAPSIDAPEVGEEQWNGLAKISETNTVFQTHEWARSWIKVFGAQCEPLLLSVLHKGQPVGIAPFVIQRGRFGRRVVRFVGDGRADYCDVLADGSKPEVLKVVFDALVGMQDRWDVIELRNIPSESSTVDLLRNIALKSGYANIVADQFICHSLVIRGHEAQARAIYHKGSLRRRENYFARQGRLDFIRLTGGEVLPYLERLFSQHVKRWSNGGSPSLFNDELNRMFYRELAFGMEGKPWLVLSAVELDGHPIAIHYGFDYNDAIIWYKPCFDVRHAKHSPGLVLLRYLIGHAIEQHRRELDFTIGDEPFKRRFTNETRKTVSISIYSQMVPFAVERCKHAVVSAMTGRS